jgi:integrase
MAGFIIKRVDPDCQRKDGTKYKRTRWRAFIPDPDKPASSGAKREKTFQRKVDAQAWLDDQKHAVKTGAYVSKDKGKTPLRDVAAIWQATWSAKNLRPKTRRDYTSLLKNHVLPTFEDTPVSAIGSVQVEQWINMLGADKHLHPESAHHAYCVLKQVMKTAVRHGYITTNPCNAESVDLPSKSDARATSDEQLALEADELRELVAAMPEHWRTPTMVAAWCGLRAGELWALRRCDVSPLHGTIRVRHTLSDVWGQLVAGPPKTQKSRRTVDVPQFLIPALEHALASPGVRIRKVRRSTGGPASGEGLPIRGGYPCIKDGELGWTDEATDPDRLLFTTPTGLAVRHNNMYRRAFEPTRDKLWPEPHRLSGLVWHDLRHTCATFALHAPGGNLHAVMTLLGHSSITTTSTRYGHRLPSVAKRLAESFNEMHAASEQNVIALHEEAS